ncbi:alpha/beta hydrolase [Geomicrobium sp. JCM 19039]|uniref:alpha/beta hydrolase n=1 Tax=Geomicrobium sp. JCM 19039 TaxID=1460636 RepID=UPI00045F2265|nr:alpha/beta hydrolase [Geomicrobium sp. JCM 19039]GAK14715.1 lysophospholipase [Geomicrobium sp. JCM 19039]
MKPLTFTLRAKDGTDLFVRKFEPDHFPKKIVLIAHGLAEHSGRYERFANVLNKASAVVYAHDQREHGETGGTFPESDVIDLMADDVHTLFEKATSEYPDIPVYVFGHSMGTVVVRRFTQVYKGITGAILCAPVHLLDEAASVRDFAKEQASIHGRGERNEAVIGQTFGSFNTPFEPARTAFDWLSRDDKEVDKYIEDPLCGGAATLGLMHDMMNAALENDKLANVEKMDRDLPVLILSGDKDPVTDFSDGAVHMKRRFEDVGLQVELRDYAEARHELLNETNREQVMDDVVDWLHRF